MLKERLRERQGGRGERVVGRVGEREEDERGGRIRKQTASLQYTSLSPSLFPAYVILPPLCARKSGPETSSIHAQAHISKTISLALTVYAWSKGTRLTARSEALTYAVEYRQSCPPSSIHAPPPPPPPPPIFPHRTYGSNCSLHAAQAHVRTSSNSHYARVWTTGTRLAARSEAQPRRHAEQY